jgi:3-oxoacyl-[acyl-carrier-protein] synthase-3
VSNGFISGIGVFLPNDPVDNARIEDVLGRLGTLSSRTKKVILRNNGILTRHYAIDPATGRATHNNAQLTAEAIRALVRSSEFSLDAMDCLVCGTSSPDQWIPNHALMVHGELGCPPCEVVATAGVCASGMTALKYAWMSVMTGMSRLAVATGSETASSGMRAAQFPPRGAADEERVEKNSLVAFEHEFLRWMLSDGAGAVRVTPQPAPRGLSLQIEWIDLISYAGEMEACMYWGARKREDGRLEGWRALDDPLEGLRMGCMNLTQDVRLLGREVGHRSINAAFSRIREKHGLLPDQIDWFLPHYSSEYFRQEVFDRFVEIGFPIPFDKWFTNLTTKGNTGSASIFIMLEGLLSSGKVRPGDRILCLVPESARFSTAYALLTATGPVRP